MTAVVAPLVALMLFLAPSSTVSRTHFARAQKLFAQERYRQALEEFTAASEKAPDEIPDLYFNIGQCHRNLGQIRQARLAFQHYLALRPDAADKKQVQALLASLGGHVRSDPPPPAMPEKGDDPVAPPDEPPDEATLPPNAAPAAIPLVAAPAPAAMPSIVANPLTDSPPRKRARRWPIWVGVAAGVAVTAIGLGVGIHYGGLGSAPSSPAPQSPAPQPAGMMAPGLGSTVTFDTRGGP